MQHLDIYIGTSIHGGTQRAGAAAYVIEYVTKDGKEASAGEIMALEGMSEHGSILHAAIAAVSRVRPGNEIVIHTESAWMVSAINKWLKDWERRGWITATGAEVRHGDLFKKIAARKETDIITAEQGTGKYCLWLKGETRRKEREALEKLNKKTNTI